MIIKSAVFVPRNQKRAVGADAVLKDGSMDSLDEDLAQTDRPGRVLRISAAIAGKAVFRFDESISGDVAARHVRRKLAKRPKELLISPFADHALKTEHLRIVEEIGFIVVNAPRH